MKTRQYVKTAEDKYFNDLDAVVSDRWLLVAGEEYDLSTVSSSEIVSEPRERNWAKFLRVELAITLVTGAIFAIASYLNWSIAGWILPLWGIGTIKDAWSEFRRPSQDILILNTDSGPVRIRTRRSDIALTGVADEINKRVNRLRLSGPLLPDSSETDALQMGEPTRRITEI